MASLTFQITGGVNVEITLTELPDGSLQFDVTALDTTGQIGDLRGLFFDLADDSLTNGMTVTGTDVTDTVFKTNGVSSTGGSNNIKGEVLNEYGKFDIGVEIGTQGIGVDDIRSTSFILSHDSVSLSLGDLEFQDMAVRLMSVGEEGGSRNGSLKLGGEVPEAGGEIAAADDAMTVYESEGAGDVDLLDGAQLSVLANDTADGAAYSGLVLDVGGSPAAVGQMVTGSNGGLLQINADGTVDFDANGEFDALFEGQSAQTTFTYGIEDGKTATVTVTILGEGQDRAAHDDAMTVMESETFGDADLLDGGAASVLANDTENGGAYTDVVGSVNGALGNVNSFAAGSNGGLLKVNADGTLDFDAGGAFDYLDAGESAETTFTYTLISGEEATVTVTVLGETDYDAVDDVLTVMESETAGDLETLDSGAASVLANDTKDGGAYTGMVEGATAGMQVVGSNGGLATIFADGSIDFDANDEFDYLGDGDSAQTVFTYEIAGGETANVTVNVLGEDDTTGGGQVINLALLVSSTSTMYAQAATILNGLAPFGDNDGNLQGNQLMDMAYLMLEDFMSDAFTVAANAGATLNVSFVTFDNTGGPGAYDVADASGFPTQFANKLTDNSADFGAGFANADAWFDTVETATSTNALFFIGDGFSSDPWDTDYAAMMTDHNVIVDAFVPDVVYNGTGFDALSTMDKDGFADSIFVEDTATANLYGVTAGVDALSLDHLLA